MASLLYKLGIKEYTDRFKTWVRNAIEGRIMQEHVYFFFSVSENLVYYKGVQTEGELRPLLFWILNMTMGKPVTPHMIVFDEAEEDGYTQVVSSNKFEVASDKLYGNILTWVYNDRKYTLHFEGEGMANQVIISEPYVSTDDMLSDKQVVFKYVLNPYEIQNGKQVPDELIGETYEYNGQTYYYWKYMNKNMYLNEYLSTMPVNSQEIMYGGRINNNKIVVVE